MGEAICKMLANHKDARIVAGVDINTAASTKTFGFPVYQNIADFPGKADVIVDFSHHSAISSLLDYAKTHKLPAVICTTGHTDEERELGHGGMDYFEFQAFFDCLKNNKPMPIDVYDAATWMCITCLSEASCAMGGQPMAIPDFTNGAWVGRKPQDVMPLGKRK